MRLTPSERDRLLIFTTAELARRRLARGVRLNVPEATALIADTVCEAARDGHRLNEAVAVGRSVLGPDDVLPGVREVVNVVKVEAVFDDGTRLVVVTDPIGAPEDAADERHSAPGGILLGAEPMVDWPAAVTVSVTNTSTVPISVTSHFHFFEANPRLRFDRAAAYGTRLAVPAGSSVRFGPGERKLVRLTPMRGERVAIGFAGLVDGPLDAPGAKQEALRRAVACGYQHEEPVAGGPAGHPAVPDEEDPS
jgi:urease subunit gamma/beta